MADHVFPEDAGTGANQGDFLDAAPFASYVDAAGLTDFVASGLTITLNASTPSFDLSSGKAVVTSSSATGAQDNETYDDGVAFVAEVDSRSGLSLTDSAVNYVYLDVNLSSDDDITVTTNTTGSAPSEPSLKIAEIDTSSDTVTEFNHDVPVSLSELSSQAHSSLTNVQSSQHHTRPTAGILINDNSNTFDLNGSGLAGNNISWDSNNNELDANATGGEKLSFITGMTEWADGLSNEEINRLVLQSGESLVVERVEFRQKGGGSSSSASVRVRDTTASTTYGSQNLGGTTKDAGETATGNTVQVQLSNSTGSAITASVIITGRIKSV